MKFNRKIFNFSYVIWCLWHKISPLIKNDEFYIKVDYYLAMKRKLNLDNPQTFNEKLQWLKLYDIRQEYTMMVDKYLVKDYVRNIIGDEYIIPTLAIWNRPEDIDINILPNEFVLKCTHDSGCVIICMDKANFDLEAARKKLASRLKKEFYLEHREYPYKNVRPRIIAEKYMVDESGSELKDYKFFCFNGDPKMMFVASGRFNDPKIDWYDEKFELLPFTRTYPNSGKQMLKPISFEKMKFLAKELSKQIPFVRVDFYDINGHIYFGELTFFPSSGNAKFEPEDWDYKVGSWLKLPLVK